MLVLKGITYIIRFLLLMMDNAFLVQICALDVKIIKAAWVVKMATIKQIMEGLA